MLQMIMQFLFFYNKIPASIKFNKENLLEPIFYIYEFDSINLFLNVGCILCIVII